MMTRAPTLRPNRGKNPGNFSLGMSHTVAMACWAVWVTPWAP